MRIEIKSVSIEGFRAIRGSLDLPWSDAADRPLHRVVLAGPNGSGKTTVLEAILLALGREDLIVRDLPAARRGDHWRVELPPGARVQLHCQRSDLPGLPPKRFVVTRSADRWEILREGDGTVVTDPVAIRNDLAQIPVEYFSSWRAPILPGGLEPTTSGRPLVDNEANRLRRLKQRIINERARGSIARDSSTAHDVEWLNQINAVWSEFHRDGSIIDADVVDAGAEDALFDLFVFDGKTRRCSIDQVSSGELELLTIAGTLLLARFAGLLLIDEPELHLHRQWQTGLLNALTAMAPDAQLIIATHADAPWDQVLSFERFFLAPAGDPRASTDQSE